MLNLCETLERNKALVNYKQEASVLHAFHFTNNFANHSSFTNTEIFAKETGFTSFINFCC